MKHLQCLVDDTRVFFAPPSAAWLFAHTSTITSYLGMRECPVTEKGSLRHCYLQQSQGSMQLGYCTRSSPHETSFFAGLGWLFLVTVRGTKYFVSSHAFLAAGLQATAGHTLVRHFQPTDGGFQRF